MIIVQHVVYNTTNHGTDGYVQVRGLAIVMFVRNGIARTASTASSIIGCQMTNHQISPKSKPTATRTVTLLGRMRIMNKCIVLTWACTWTLIPGGQLNKLKHVLQRRIFLCLKLVRIYNGRNRRKMIGMTRNLNSPRAVRLNNITTTGVRDHMDQ